MGKTENIIIRTDKTTKAKVEKLARDSKRSVSDYLRLLIQYANDKQIIFNSEI